MIIAVRGTAHNRTSKNIRATTIAHYQLDTNYTLCDNLTSGACFKVHTSHICKQKIRGA